jgi:hypothetical protein
MLSPTLSDLGFIDTCTEADYARMEEEQQQQQAPAVDTDLAGMTFEQRLALLCDDDSSDGEQVLGITAGAAGSRDAGSCAGSAAGDAEQQQEEEDITAAAAAALPGNSPVPAAAVQEVREDSSSSIGSAAGPAEAADSMQQQQQVCCTPLLPAHLASKATQTSPAVADAAAQVGPCLREKEQRFNIQTCKHASSSFCTQCKQL